MEDGEEPTPQNGTERDRIRHRSRAADPFVEFSRLIDAANDLWFFLSPILNITSNVLRTHSRRPACRRRGASVVHHRDVDRVHGDPQAIRQGDDGMRQADNRDLQQSRGGHGDRYCSGGLY